MDTSDPEIRFDANGVCSHCDHFAYLQGVFPKDPGEREKKLSQLIDRVRRRGREREYDCVVGVSGGVDSSYLAYLSKEWGLRPLCVHFDSGWNSELAVKNIESLIRALSLDLFTFVCDWEEMRDLQLAFFRAGVANADIPQDHGYLAALYQVANKFKIPTILSGSNAATESILPTSWMYDARDSIHLRGIHRRFGKGKLKKYPIRSVIKFYFYDPYLNPIEFLRPLNYFPYVKSDVMAVLERKLGWRYYGGKHYESVFTRFFQGYYLPKRFHIDKRRAHLSSLILSGQTTRDAALREMSLDAYPPDLLRQDFSFIATKLGISELELAELIDSPPVSPFAYPTSHAAINFLRSMKRSFVRIRRAL